MPPPRRSEPAKKPRLSTANPANRSKLRKSEDMDDLLSQYVSQGRESQINFLYFWSA